MGLIKTFFGLVLIAVFVVFGYWMYATYTAETADDPIWAGINSLMPGVLRQWSCQEIRPRTDAEPAPQSCAEYWDVPAQEEVAAPGMEQNGGSRRNDGQAVETAPAGTVGAD